ncbi:hypothetical protein MRS76_20440 [Rhizobiaceae bacterium n13]|uniref:Uncharacterized protein n=1 Tax=Ferirhizobium litorale TaxID=2927786 RepID=A0AAE3U5Z7_9HYPH|nr:hypothetical protein [Fererhizobium litorale]MDI7864311.1 hypothetical protein [Fererhizobium litorale]MDI7924584.1 hypothetical protein [Fererhizobium litorale]
MADAHVMWTISQIAERDGVSKAAVSKTVKKLAEDRPDTPIERGMQGQVQRVSLAHYDHYRQRHVNPAKATAPIRSVVSSASAPIDPSDTFEEARRQAEWLKVGRERIRHQEDIGQLLRRDRVEEAQRTIGRDIQNIIRRLQNKADAVALAVSKEGVHGARVELRRIAFELGNEIADRLAVVADQAAEVDEPIEDEEQ